MAVDVVTETARVISWVALGLLASFGFSVGLGKLLKDSGQPSMDSERSGVPVAGGAPRRGYITLIQVPEPPKDWEREGWA